jgi:hypothetical protein
VSAMISLFLAFVLGRVVLDERRKRTELGRTGVQAWGRVVGHVLEPVDIETGKRPPPRIPIISFTCEGTGERIQFSSDMWVAGMNYPVDSIVPIRYPADDPGEALIDTKRARQWYLVAAAIALAMAAFGLFQLFY